MNQDRLGGTLRQLGGHVKRQWGALTHDSRTVASGTRDCVLGRIQELRGISKQEADRQLDEFMNRNRNWWDLSAH